MQKSYADYTVIQSQSQSVPIRKYLKTVGTKYYNGVKTDL